MRRLIKFMGQRRQYWNKTVWQGAVVFIELKVDQYPLHTEWHHVATSNVPG